MPDCPELNGDCCEQRNAQGELRSSGLDSTGSSVFYDSATTFGNTPQTYTATCATGGIGSPVTVTVGAGIVKSAVSQAAANALALASATSQAQASLVCTFVNAAQCCTVECPPDTSGDDVTECVSAELFTSTVSQADADAQAQAAACLIAASGLDCNGTCTGAAPTIEKVMRAVQERQYVITGVYVNWPDSTISGDPGNYPANGFYASDIAAAADPDARRAELIQAISDVIGQSWITSYSPIRDWSSLAAIPTFDHTLMPPPTVTADNYEESLLLLQSYACSLTTIIKNAFQADVTYYEGTGTSTDCATAKADAISTFGAVGGFGFDAFYSNELSGASLVGLDTVYTIVIGVASNTMHYNLGIFTNHGGDITVWGSMTYVGSAPAHIDVLPAGAELDGLFHSIAFAPPITLGTADAQVTFPATIIATSELGCVIAGTSNVQGWQSTNFPVVQVYKSSVPGAGEWDYYP